MDGLSNSSRRVAGHVVLAPSIVSGLECLEADVVQAMALAPVDRSVSGRIDAGWTSDWAQAASTRHKVTGVLILAATVGVIVIMSIRCYRCR